MSANFSLDRAAIIQVAMDEELAPFLELTEAAAEPMQRGIAVLHPRLYHTAEGTYPLLLVRSKIGLVNAASALSFALAEVENCPLVISAGTAGGLRADVNVGDLALGNTYTYTDADATAFGYVRGQVPGMPEFFSTSQQLAEVATHVAQGYEGEGKVFTGQMLAGGSFVTAHNVKDTREVFPQAISTDMETTALAQVCANLDLPFIAARGISDLCGPEADQDFHLGVEVVGPRSAALSLAILTAFLETKEKK